MAEKLTLNQLREAVAKNAAAFRCRRRLQPAGGAGDKVFPPTYAGATYSVAGLGPVAGESNGRGAAARRRRRAN